MIQRSKLFAGLSPSEVGEILSYARPRVVEKNDVLYMQGQPFRNIYLLESGSIKLTQLSSGGSEVILWLCGPGDAAGVNGIVGRANYTCSARAIETCRALVLDWPRIEQMLDLDTRLRKNVHNILSDRITELEERFREIATEKVARRVALELLRAAHQIGRPVREGVHVALSREELAQLTGTTLFTISRLISQWCVEGMVTPRREAVLVIDAHRLSFAHEAAS